MFLSASLEKILLVEWYWGFFEKVFAFLTGRDKAGKTFSPLPPVLAADILPGTRTAILRLRRKEQETVETLALASQTH